MFYSKKLILISVGYLIFINSHLICMNKHKIDNLFLDFICNQDLLSEEIVKDIKEKPALETLLLNKEYTIERKREILTCEKFRSRFNYIISLSKDLDVNAIFNFIEKDFFKYFELNIISKYLQLLDDINYFENEIDEKNKKIIELKKIKHLTLESTNQENRELCKKIFFETKENLTLIKTINNANKNMLDDSCNQKDLLIIIMGKYNIDPNVYRYTNDIKDSGFFENETNYKKVFKKLNMYETYIKNYLELINRTFYYKKFVKPQEERSSTPIFAIHPWP